MNEELGHLLADLDDPKWWEQPPGFDRAAARQRAQLFREALNGRLPTPATLETGSSVQDASFHSELRLQGGSLRFSSFGEMIAFTPDHSVPAEVVESVRELAGRHGYRLIPTEILEEPYTGKNPGVTGIRTWWIRFFDYV